MNKQIQIHAEVTICPECGREFKREAYLDHLFSSKECMRKYWKEEEKTHPYRLRKLRSMTAKQQTK